MQESPAFQTDDSLYKQRVVLYACTALIVLLVVVAAGFSLRYLHLEKEKDATVASRYLARALDQTVERLFEAVDLSLQASADEISRRLAEGKPAAKIINTYLGQQQDRLPWLLSLQATDETGRVVYGRGISSPPGNIFMSGITQESLSHVEGRFVWGEPLRTKNQETWGWPFARRFNKPDGSFGGVVFAIIPVEYIDGLLSEIKLASNDSIALRDVHLRLIARYPPASTVNLVAGDGRISDPFAQALQVAPNEGSYISGIASVDGVSRIHSYRRSKTGDFVVNVGLSSDAAMAEWRIKASIISALAVIFILLAIGFARIVVRGWQRHQKDMETIVSSKKVLQESCQIAGLGHYSFDVAADRWTSSQTLDEIFGIGDDYPRDAEHWLALVAADLRQTMREYLQAVTLKSQGFDQEYRIVRALDGEERWVHGKGRVHTDARDKRVYLSGTIQDITERKQIEAAKSAETLRTAALLKLPEAASAMREQAFMQYGQELAEDLTGSLISFVHFVNADEDTIELVTWSHRTLEQYCHAAFDKHYPVSHAGIWADALRQKKVVVFNDYLTYPHKHGLPEGHSELKRLISLPVLENGKVVMLVGVGNKPENYSEFDIETVQLIAEAIWTLVQRRRAEATASQFSKMLDQSKNEIYIFDEESLRFIDANQGARSNTGYSVEELRGMSPLDIKHDLSPDFFNVLVADLRAGKIRQTNFSTYHYRKDGSRYPVEVHLEITDDAPRRFVAVVLDVSERIATERQQKVLETQLLQAQKMELIGQLTGGIAHDFNNILVSILGYAELLQMMADRQQIPKMSRYVDEILQAGIRAKELVSQLLTFSQRREEAAESISVGPMLAEVAKLLRSTLPASITIDTVVADELPEVLISPVQLHQVLMNMGVNARGAIGARGSVVFRAEQVVLHITKVCESCHREYSGSYILISVHDSGCGIPPEIRSKIFEPFFTTKAKGGGSGLGLSVLHGIVHSGNGHIEIITAPGEGCDFRVYLPIHSRHETQQQNRIKRNDGGVLQGHVMVVDDEEVIVSYLTELLEMMGCRVTGLTSASEALRIFRENPECVDMVISDITMPEINGMDLAREMLAIRSGLPIVLNTGYSQAIDEEWTRDIGIRRILLKPVPAKVIEDIVAECLKEVSLMRAEFEGQGKV